MGKSKKRSRASSARLNPVSGGGRHNAKDDALVNKRLQPLLIKLQSIVPNDRAMALGSISVLCEDPYMRKTLLKQRLANIILSKLLTDDNTDIVVESCGLLRNLCLEEGYDLSTYLWRSDIWASVNQGFDRLLKSLDALQKKEEQISDAVNRASTESKRLLFDYADNLISLVVALANGSDEILKQILNVDKINRVFDVITQLLKYGLSKLPLAVVNTILDLLYDFSSESFAFIDAVESNQLLSEFVRGLPQLMNNDSFNELTQVLIQGIQLQFSDMNITYEQSNETIHTVCRCIKDIDLKQVQADLSSLPQDEELVKTQDSQVAQKIKDYLKARSSGMMKLQSVEIAIDLITAIIEIVASLYEERKTPLPESLLETLTVFLPHIFQHLGEEFSSRILIAWNNLLWLYLTLEINFLELPNEPHKYLWEIINALPDTDLALKMGKLSVMWAILKTITSQSRPAEWLLFFQLQNNGNFVRSIIESYNKDISAQDMAPEDIIQLGQRYCGVLCTYSTFQGQTEMNDLIGQFILKQLLSKDVPQYLLVEFTNSLFEIYSDGNFDYNEPVFVKNGFLDILEKQVAPNLKARFKLVDRNKDAQLKENCNECFTTLESFIQYKKNE